MRIFKTRKDGILEIVGRRRGGGRKRGGARGALGRRGEGRDWRGNGWRGDFVKHNFLGVEDLMRSESCIHFIEALDSIIIILIFCVKKGFRKNI